ncbi:transcriptional regulator, TetR family [Mycobacterium xenopi 4042]|uniref:Transcriptional regulator, TetR family n=1 Tax=Mycobacterium xenopi 4042 TaxID=1299334 RepID=X7ZLG8_MYCXE|nr:transcriptional regulator, TetR family [Mycobacterium xenopi 4042]
MTKGSFYWHFSDMKAYRRALIDTWATVRDEDRGFFDSVADDPPRQRLSRMMTAMVGRGIGCSSARCVNGRAPSPRSRPQYANPTSGWLPPCGRLHRRRFRPGRGGHARQRHFRRGHRLLHLSGSRPNPRPPGAASDFST